MLKTFKVTKGEEDMDSICSSYNVNEEYDRAIGTKSYLDFLMKAQISSPSHRLELCDFFLNPNQETVAKVLESSVLFKKLCLKKLLVKYFDMSVEVSRICSHLLMSIDQIHSSYGLIENILSSIHEDQTIMAFAPQLQSFLIVTEPTFSVAKQEFKDIHDELLSITSDLNSKRKKISRRVKTLTRLNKASRIFFPIACGLFTAVTLILAAHIITPLVIASIMLSIPTKLPLKKKMTWLQPFRLGFLKRAANQVDAATRGTYIFNRDFDTMSRLIDRINDEIEYNRSMVKTCLERKGREKYYSCQVVKELKRGDVGFN